MSLESTAMSSEVVVSGSMPSTCREVSEAQHALSASPIVELRELLVEASGAGLTISGCVHSFYHKQIAQETVRPHANGLRLLNEVRVKVLPR